MNIVHLDSRFDSLNLGEIVNHSRVYAVLIGVFAELQVALVSFHVTEKVSGRFRVALRAIRVPIYRVNLGLRQITALQL